MEEAQEEAYNTHMIAFISQISETYNKEMKNSH